MMSRRFVLGLVAALFLLWAVPVWAQTTTITDNFTQSNENPLSSSGTWVAAYDTACGSSKCLQVISNGVQNQTGASRNGMKRTETVANDQWAQVTCTTITASNSECGVILRWTAGADAYGCWITAPFGQARIVGLSLGAPTTLASTAYTPASGDVVYCEVQGTNMILKVNGSTKITFDYTGSGYELASGTVGIASYADSVPANTVINAFRAGDFSTPPATGRSRGRLF